MNNWPFNNATQDSYKAGRALFFTGKMPCGAHDARELTANYDALSPTDKRIADGWFDARDDQRNAFLGTLPPSTRPMLHYTAPVQDVPSFEDAVMLTADQARKRGLIRKGMSKAFRRKGRNAIVIRTNGGGTTITWQGQVFPIDGLNADEKDKLVANVFAAAYPDA